MEDLTCHRPALMQLCDLCLFTCDPKAELCCILTWPSTLSEVLSEQTAGRGCFLMTLKGETPSSFLSLSAAITPVSVGLPCV